MRIWGWRATGVVWMAWYVTVAVALAAAKFFLHSELVQFAVLLALILVSPTAGWFSKPHQTFASVAVFVVVYVAVFAATIAVSHAVRRHPGLALEIWIALPVASFAQGKVSRS